MGKEENSMASLGPHPKIFQSIEICMNKPFDNSFVFIFYGVFFPILCVLPGMQSP